MIKKFARVIACLACAVAVSFPVVAAAKDRIVLQVSDENPKTWGQTLNVAGNLMKDYGKGNIEIEVVVFGRGSPMLKADAIIANRVRDAVGNGVHVLQCENSMKRFKLKKDDMNETISYVPAGITHIIKRNKEGWVVVRP
jgi:intracellular sulfur oxidation DsrE/DsrF family protein